MGQQLKARVKRMRRARWHKRKKEEAKVAKATAKPAAAKKPA